MASYGEKAAQLFRDKKCNCAQAVLIALGDQTGMDEETALRASASFGGGMGRMREVCGAVSGALMALGLAKAPVDPADQAAKMEHYRRVQLFAQRFKELHGAIVCRELLGEKLAGSGYVPAERTEEYYKMRPCERLVYDAAELMAQMLEELE